MTRDDARAVGGAAGAAGRTASAAREAAGLVRLRGQQAAVGWDGPAERAYLARLQAVVRAGQELGEVAERAAAALRAAAGELAAAQEGERHAGRVAAAEGLRVRDGVLLPWTADVEPARAARQVAAADVATRLLAQADASRREAHDRLAARLRHEAGSVPRPLPGSASFTGPVLPAPDFWVAPPPSLLDRFQDALLSTPAGAVRDGAAATPDALTGVAEARAARAVVAGQEARDIRPNKINGLWSQAGRRTYKEALREVRVLRVRGEAASAAAARVPGVVRLVDDLPGRLAAPADAAPGHLARGVRLAGRVPGLPALSAGVGFYGDLRGGESVAQAGVSQGAALGVGAAVGTGVLAVVTAPGWVPVAGAVAVGGLAALGTNWAVDKVWDAASGPPPKQVRRPGPGARAGASAGAGRGPGAATCTVAGSAR